jgi:hypothetical protein
VTAALAWLVWLLLLLTAGLAALTAASTLAVVVVGFPLGAGIRARRGEWPAWYVPMLRLWLWVLAVAAVSGGMALVYWYGLR